MQVLSDGYVITGATENSVTGAMDVVLIKTDTAGVVGIENKFSPLMPIQCIIYPNPFSNFATIKLEKNEKQITNYELKLYDLLGREVKKLKIENYQLRIYRDNLPNGLYFYQIKNSQEIIASGKIIIQ